MLMRDLRPFWRMNFAYHWSGLLEKVNTAVLGIQKNKSAFIENLYRKTLERLNQSVPIVVAFHPSNFSTVLRSQKYDDTLFTVFHSVLFDPGNINHLLQQPTS